MLEADNFCIANIRDIEGGLCVDLYFIIILSTFLWTYVYLISNLSKITASVFTTFLLSIER